MLWRMSLWLVQHCREACMHMRRDRKHYSQQADYAGFDGDAGQDQPEALSGSKGGFLDARKATCPHPHV